MHTRSKVNKPLCSQNDVGEGRSGLQKAEDVDDIGMAPILDGVVASEPEAGVPETGLGIGGVRVRGLAAMIFRLGDGVVRPLGTCRRSATFRA